MVDDRPAQDIYDEIQFEQRKSETKIYVFEACSHIFHGDCLREYLKSEINEAKFPLHCPLVECKKEIKVSELKNLLSPELQHKFEERTLNLAVDHQDDLSWCPTPDCTYAFVFEEGQTKFTCPSCSKDYCLSCRMPFHNNQTCAEYRVSNNFSKDDEKFMKFVKGKKFKQC